MSGSTVRAGKRVSSRSIVSVLSCTTTSSGVSTTGMYLMPVRGMMKRRNSRKVATRSSKTTPL
ncbi:MAG: hypothetical protein C0434_14480 [Xanthomonadaceae bacterium]|nr:hypothetical protein [Xanthomonadaceae bacterium]